MTKISNHLVFLLVWILLSYSYSEPFSAEFSMTCDSATQQMALTADRI